jgi:hypothetical protein
MITLYRFYSEEGRLLYVGITDNLYRRLWSHATEQPWWGLVDYFDTEDLEVSGVNALEYERYVILNERPLFNKEHNLDQDQRVTGCLDGFLFCWCGRRMRRVSSSNQYRCPDIQRVSSGFHHGINVTRVEHFMFLVASGLLSRNGLSELVPNLTDESIRELFTVYRIVIVSVRRESHRGKCRDAFGEVDVRFGS